MKLEQQQNSVRDPVDTESETAGWDPFQVWRTRVREPQMRATGGVPDARVSEPAPALLKSA
ncbi:MAG TPA: hypothetical protein VE046_06960 [Steroidobacteraceae bacterium]|nr:hypothetical protein [Steroidobacteraceae bacterium]